MSGSVALIGGVRCFEDPVPNLLAVPSSCTYFKQAVVSDTVFAVCCLSCAVLDGHLNAKKTTVLFSLGSVCRAVQQHAHHRVQSVLTHRRSGGDRRKHRRGKRGVWPGGVEGGVVDEGTTAHPGDTGGSDASLARGEQPRARVLRPREACPSKTARSPPRRRLRQNGWARLASR